MHEPTWHILGAGSIGCLFAAYLSHAHHPVTLILRNEAALAAFRLAGGIHLQRPDGGLQAIGCEAINLEQVSITGQSTHPIKRVLVCTKAHQTLEAITALRPALADNALLVLLQNGMGVRELIQPLFPRATIAQATTTEGAWRRGAFEIVHAGRGETLLGTASTEAAGAENLAAALHCELDIRADNRFETRQWFKLAVNCVINPLTALRECRNGDLLTHSDIQRDVRQLCTELCAIAQACGQALSVQQLEQTVFDVMRSTAANQSSMWQDLQRRRRTEIDFINGYVVRQGRINSIDCPTHETLLQSIKQKEMDLGCV